MRIKLYSCAIFILLFIYAYFSATSIHNLVTSQDQGKAETEHVTNEGTKQVPDTPTNELMNEIMGMEVCYNNDEEGLARKMVAEAHLDYIYTQRHTP